MKIEQNMELIDVNVEEIKRLMIDKYQKLSGIKLTEASPETMIFNSVAYMIALREEKYNDDLKQNFLRFARNERLDLKGEFYGKRGERLKSRPARAMFKFKISKEQNYDTVISKGSRIRYNDMYFITDEEYIIKKGTIEVEGMCTCNILGSVGNGIPIGQINEMVDIYPNYTIVENITITSDGSDIEEDEGYRKRIREIPNSFTTAGSKESYSFWAKSSNPNIIDVKVVSPSPTKVDVYILTNDGNVTSEIKSSVSKVLNDENIRPLTDKVEVKSPNIINFDIDFDYFIDKENEAIVNSIKSNVDKVVNDYVLWQREKLGRSINPDELIKRLKLIGVKRTVIRKPQYTKLEFDQIGILQNKNITYQGVEEL